MHHLLYIRLSDNIFIIKIKAEHFIEIFATIVIHSFELESLSDKIKSSRFHLPIVIHSFEYKKNEKHFIECFASLVKHKFAWESFIF